MKKVTFIMLAALAVSACEPGTQAAKPTETALTQEIGPAIVIPTAAAVGPVPSATPLTGLPAFVPPGVNSFNAKVSLSTWTPPTTAAGDVTLPLQLNRLGNRPVIEGLTAAEQAFLATNGFVVVHTQEAQFADIRDEVALRQGQPYYLTTDAAFHALHLTFDELLKSLEREQLRPRMLALVQATLAETEAASRQLEGTAIEADAKQSIAYLAVAARLLDPTTAIEPTLESQIAKQVDQVVTAGGTQPSVLFPDFKDDYGAYKPVGHYAGDPALEAYFRGMTWLGRVHIRLAAPEDSSVKPSRLPLIITLALRRATVGGTSGAAAWSTVHDVLTFLIGPTDDGGPIEYAWLMDQVYGVNPGYGDLADEGRWIDFQSRRNELPAPRINSTFLNWTSDLAKDTGWRFLGQRFTLDANIMQNLVFDQVKDLNGERRLLPSGRDVMVVLGSKAALASLAATGDTRFPNYTDQVRKLQQAIQAQPTQEWLGRFYDAWLYAFLPTVAAKGPGYPAIMQTSAWGYKELNAALGSWAELKHDTILYTKMPEAMGGGGPPSSGPAPGYVEPNPDVFYRLAYMAASVADGLTQRDMASSTSATGGNPEQGYDVQLQDLVWSMDQLAERFQLLGDIAVKELTGQALTEDEAWAIQSCLGIEECEVGQKQRYGMPAEMKPAPIVAAVAGAGPVDAVLEVATGNVDRIFVVVRLGDGVQVAQGGVYSYYEFTQPRAQRLTDEEWRRRLASADPPLPVWAGNFVMTGGGPRNWLAFRVGDVYIVSPAGADLNLRERPTTSAKILGKLKAGDYLEFVDGPVEADGYTWWKVGTWMGSGESGAWVVEDQAWYERAYGQ